MSITAIATTRHGQKSMTDIWKRDWPGIMATSFTVALFCVSVFMVTSMNHTLSDLRRERQVLEDEIKKNRELIVEVQLELNKINEQ